MGADPLELINRRRRQIHVHSVIYYHYLTSIISDGKYDAWTLELLSLQARYPKLKYKGYLSEYFRNWNGNTGMDLPVTERVKNLAEELLRMEQRDA